MTEHEELTRILNEALSLEYTSAVQYNQYSVLLTGPNKVLYEHLFKESAEEALGHARKWAGRIVYLGGVPKPEVREVRRATDIAEMLEIALETEKKAVEIYSRAHKACDHEPTRYMLEHQISDEDSDVERLQKLLGKVGTAYAVPKGSKKPAA